MSDIIIIIIIIQSFPHDYILRLDYIGQAIILW